MPNPIPSHDEVRAAFDNGSIINASKKELERFLVANGQARILHDANQARASEMGETMRQLLAARQSEEMHSEALRISKVALWFSVAAFVVGLAGVAASLWPFAFPSPTQVYSLQTNPVHVLSAEPQHASSQATARQSPSGKSAPPTDSSAHDRQKN